MTGYCYLFFGRAVHLFKCYFGALFYTALSACAQPVSPNIVHPEGTDVASRFAVPAGYVRTNCETTTFAYYLRHLPLKDPTARVHYYNGQEKPNHSVAAAVVDISVGKRDLQQCADAVIRLRAEYLYEQKQYSRIHFNFTNGFRADYATWAKGNRIKVDGNKVSWYPSGGEDYSYPAFFRYLETIFTYAGTLSLSKELKTTSCSDLQAGDVWIQGGSPGHAVIVVDVAVNPANGNKIYLLAQSYMPAQDIHVLNNPNNSKISPWYELQCDHPIYTPEWTFRPENLKRFEE